MNFSNDVLLVLLISIFVSATDTDLNTNTNFLLLLLLILSVIPQNTNNCNPCCGYTGNATVCPGCSGF